MPARKNTTTLTNAWRDRIRSGVIMQRLEKCALGELEMTPDQLKATDILLRKIIPDLQRQELTGPNGKKLSFSNVTLQIVHPEH